MTSVFARCFADRLPLDETIKSVCAGVWVGAQVDPLVVFVGVVSELGWG